LKGTGKNLCTDIENCYSKIKNILSFFRLY
jgi:hypothetical protein